MGKMTKFKLIFEINQKCKIKTGFMNRFEISRRKTIEFF